MDFKKNIKYFSAFNLKTPIIVTVVGIILFWMELVLPGLLAVAGGIGFIVLKLIGRISDQEYDAVVLSNLNDINQKALNKLGVDEDEVSEITPITFDGYVIKGFDYAKLFMGRNDYHRSDFWCFYGKNK